MSLARPGSVAPRREPLPTSFHTSRSSPRQSRFIPRLFSSSGTTRSARFMGECFPSDVADGSFPQRGEAGDQPLARGAPRSFQPTLTRHAGSTRAHRATDRRVPVRPRYVQVWLARDAGAYIRRVGPTAPGRAQAASTSWACWGATRSRRAPTAGRRGARHDERRPDRDLRRWHPADRERRDRRRGRRQRRHGRAGSGRRRGGRGRLLTDPALGPLAPRAPRLDRAGPQPMLAIASSPRLWISSGVRSSLCVAISHSCPNGSVTLP